jgi:Spy/CpxP family protein refolding chaperone
MRRAGTLALVAVAVVSTARAQGNLEALKNTTPKERAAAQTMMMAKKLDLTAAQKPKIEAINQKYAERMEPVLKGSEGPMVKMRSARDIESQKEAELKEVLTPEQFSKFLADKEQMREQMIDRVREQRGQHPQ